MELISSADALSFLSKSAPRPWIKKMLMWMIYSYEITPYFREGKSEEIISSSILLSRIDGYDKEGSALNSLIRSRYPRDIADSLIKNPAVELKADVVEWGHSDAPEEISAGYFIFADELDWEKGIVRAEIDRDTGEDRHLFLEDDALLGAAIAQKLREFQRTREPERRPWEIEDDDNLFGVHKVYLGGMCFNRDQLEMLQPQFPLDSEKTIASRPAQKIGRPRLWNWDGARLYLMGVAQSPNRLPTGPGSQAKVERLISQWFIENYDDSPSESQIRKEAQAIVAALKAPESR